MSIKDLFNKKSNKVGSTEKTADDFSEVESINYVSEYSKEAIRITPDIDFEEPSNFAMYGLAQKYYIDAIQTVYKTYPYDGSFAEKQKWHNENSDLVNYIFNDVYPRQNGFINLGLNYGTSSSTVSGYSNTDTIEYIHFNGTFNDGNVYDATKNRTYNLKIDGESGNTVEFYFKKDNLSGSSKQVLLDVWNSSPTGSDSYGRFKIEIHPGISGEEDSFFIELSSGSTGVVSAELGTALDFSSSWKHYGISCINYGSNLKLELYVNGDLASSIVTGSAISQIKGAIKGQIGSLITAASGTLTDRGWGKLSGSLDEFRFWKTRRTEKEVARNYFLPIGAGVNTDTSNTSLGVYYKFNEGIYSTTSVSNFDKVVLDYSGRTSNGAWTGYSLGSRTTGSAIILSQNADKEFRDPIVYAGHPSIISLISTYSSKGYEYDVRNSSNLYSTLPSWITDEDQQNGMGTQTLLQIIGEYFDELHNKIKFLPTIKNIVYNRDKPLPFTIKLLENQGFEAIDIFTDSSILENFLNRNEQEEYDESLYTLKNYIYQNIYNNLLHIYRSKGTENSFRNLIHCFGIDESLLKFNLYTNNSEFLLKDNLKYGLVKKKNINFNKPNSFGGTIYQKAESGNTDSVNYITASTDIKSLGTTVEMQAIFPRKFDSSEPFFFATDFLTSSLFGLHESTDGTWASPDRASVQVFAVRDKLESRDVYFQLSSSYFGINLTSSVFRDVYDDNMWNFALRIKPEKYPLVGHVSGAVVENNYILELYGTNYIQDIERNSFKLATSVTSSLMDGFYSANKMMYLGSHRTNFSGSIVFTSNVFSQQKSDVQIVSSRFWNSYLSDTTIKNHAKDISSYGARDDDYLQAVRQIVLNNTSSYGEQELPQQKTLALNWAFHDSTSSAGSFVVHDGSSGSLALANTDLLSKYSGYQHTGYGEFFDSTDIDVVRNEYLNSAKIQLPEVLSPDDLTEILDQDDEYFTRDSRPLNQYFMLEKSMYSVISQEMISWLGTVNEFNNLIGKPISRYESKYKDLERMRELFFKNVESEPDFERFIEFYKWIDDSISRMFQQLVPASLDYVEGVSSVVESHVLERNKYRHKLPTIEFAGDPPLGGAKSINYLLYDWQRGHAPLSGLEKNNCQWWLLRAERTGSLNVERVGIFNASLQALNRSYTTVYNFEATDLSGSIIEKKRELGIIMNEVGFDLSGTEFFEITDILPPSSDCDD